MLPLIYVEELTLEDALRDVNFADFLHTHVPNC
jgi:hypothetical protein